MVGQEYFKRGGGKRAFEGRQKCTKYIIINNISENFTAARLLPGRLHPTGPL